MATIPVSNDTELRAAIQGALTGDVIELTGAGPFSATTLAKFTCFSPLVPQGGYTVQSASGSKLTLNNTRIYQQNIDGPYAPSNVNNVILNYSSGNTAIFRATSGTYTFDDIDITGTHGGWAGNGSVYMSMTVSNGATPINTSLTLSNSTISVAGQSGFNAAAGTGSVSAFMQSWNNSGNVTLNNNSFDEAGYKTSFHFANMLPGGAAANPAIGSYTLTDNTFSRSANATVRDRGNRLESVTATLNGNTFSDGSYLDLAGNISGMTIGSPTFTPGDGNSFNTLFGGTGINVTKTSSSGAGLSATTTTLIAFNTFTGYGMALTYAATGAGDVFTANLNNYVTAGTLIQVEFDKLIAGGSGDNSINSVGTDDWINGGAGNDTISSGNGSDYIIGGLGADNLTPGGGLDTILYYGTNEGGDTITGFVPGAFGDKLAFRTGGGGATAFSSSTIFEASAPTTAAPTLSYVGGVLSYDVDGNGGGAAVTIATFAGSPSITAADILLF